LSRLSCTIILSISKSNCLKSTGANKNRDCGAL
jgi:hypothetical protein